MTILFSSSKVDLITSARFYFILSFISLSSPTSSFLYFVDKQQKRCTTTTRWFEMIVYLSLSPLKGPC